MENRMQSRCCDIVLNIKKELRANMNGVASTRMREGGLEYHLNFGIELPRLQLIASEFEPNHEVAQQLWHENVRESKILAGILMPVDRFFPEVADIWAEQIPNAEIAQMTVLNLFSRLPYATDKAFEWIARDNETLQLCGYLILTRKLIEGAELNERSRHELIDQMSSIGEDAGLPLRKAVANLKMRLM